MDPLRLIKFRNFFAAVTIFLSPFWIQQPSRVGCHQLRRMVVHVIMTLSGFSIYFIDYIIKQFVKLKKFKVAMLDIKKLYV